MCPLCTINLFRGPAIILQWSTWKSKCTNNRLQITHHPFILGGGTGRFTAVASTRVVVLRGSTMCICSPEWSTQAWVHPVLGYLWWWVPCWWLIDNKRWCPDYLWRRTVPYPPICIRRLVYRR